MGSLLRGESAGEAVDDLAHVAGDFAYLVADLGGLYININNNIY